MLGFDDDAHAGRLEDLVDGVRDLLGQPLLHQHPPREDVDDARQLREAHDPTVRDVGHVTLSEERQHVVLAQTVQLDVPHEHHAAMILREHGIADDVGRGLRVARRQERHGLRHSLGRLHQSLPIGILAE